MSVVQIHPETENKRILNMKRKKLILLILALSFFFFGVDINLCDQMDINSEDSSLPNSEKEDFDPNFFQRNAEDICWILFFTSLICLVTGELLIQHGYRK